MPLSARGLLRPWPGLVLLAVEGCLSIDGVQVRSKPDASMLDTDDGSTDADRVGDAGARDAGEADGDAREVDADVPGDAAVGDASASECPGGDGLTSPARVSAYEDTDRDGVGAGIELWVCPLELAARGLVTRAGDCAADDGAAWQLLPYLTRDRDGDDHYASSSGTVCAGEVLPAGYSALDVVDDCDDDDARRHESVNVCRDRDRDGVGGENERSTICTGAGVGLPDGYAVTCSDCDDDDDSRATRKQFLLCDLDRDSYGVFCDVWVCAGERTPDGYLDEPSEIGDCDDTDPNAFIELTTYVDSDGDGFGAGASELTCGTGEVPEGRVAGPEDCAPDDVTRWQWRGLFPDRDGDGIGAYPYEIFCIGDTLPPGYSKRGDDDNDNNPNVP